MSNSRDTFQRMFERTTTEVKFDPAWKNNTGYYDYAVKADLGLRPGESAKFTEPSPNDRRGIIVGTEFGNVVVFERYSPEGEERSAVYVSNMPDKIRQLCTSYMGIGSALAPDGIDFLLGRGLVSGNIGARLKALMS